MRAHNERIAHLARNIAAIRERFGPGIVDRRLPLWITAETRPGDLPATLDGTIRGAACRVCGADDWRKRKGRGHDCRSCERQRAKDRKARRRAQRALAGMDGRTA